MTASRGPSNAEYRVLPHTADAIIEAEADDAPSCLEAAVRAFVEIFARPPASRERAERIGVEVTAADPLGELLEEVVYRLDTSDLVAFDAEIAEISGPTTDPASGYRGDLIAVPAARVEVHGSAPKGVASATLSRHKRRWHARAIVDV